MKSCEGCPAQQMVMLAEAVGADEAARKIESSGCSWWQHLPVTLPNGQQDVVEGCMRQNLRHYMAAYGMDIRLAADTVQKDRSEQARALEAIEAAIREHGGGAVLQALGQLGMRTALGAAIAGQIENGPAPEGTGPQVDSALPPASGDQAP